MGVCVEPFFFFFGLFFTFLSFLHTHHPPPTTHTEDRQAERVGGETRRGSVLYCTVLCCAVCNMYRARAGRAGVT